MEGSWGGMQRNENHWDSTFLDGFVAIVLSISNINMKETQCTDTQLGQYA